LSSTGNFSFTINNPPEDYIHFPISQQHVTLYCVHRMEKLKNMSEIVVDYDNGGWYLDKFKKNIYFFPYTAYEYSAPLQNLEQISHFFNTQHYFNY
jgi:hypothetical protein